MDHTLCIYGTIERKMRPQLVSGGNHMTDMLVKLYNIPHSHDIEKKQEAFVMESFTDALNQSNLEKIRVWRLVLC